jgi:tripartite-type tricarboxylate transporter receptor subunit TctC
VSAQGYVLVVHPALPVKSVADLVHYMKANPDKLNYSSIVLNWYGLLVPLRDRWR